MIDPLWTLCSPVPGDKAVGRRRTTPARLGAVLALTAAVILAALAPVSLQAQAQGPDPSDRYRTFQTPHFQVVYGPGLDEVARRAATWAERGYAILAEDFFPPPRGRIEILVVDHMDLSNGFAMVAPAPRIVLWARPPVDGGALSYYDDWIGLLTLHELAHVFHLEQTGVPGRVVRRVFGRAPLLWPAFPGTLLPTWGVEGFATQLESELTDAGRVHGTGHRGLVRAQALEGEIERLGQALGTSPVWPGGTRPYVFGSLFFHWLDERYGSDAVRRFLQIWAEQWVPFRMNAAMREAVGRDLDELWDEWRREFTQGLPAHESPGEPLTQGARSAAHPTPLPDGTLAYIRSDGRSDPRLVVRRTDGSEVDLARWNAGIGTLAAAPDGSMVATQLDYVDRWRVRSDLYRVEASGRVVRLTRGLRVSHADVDPVTGRIVAVQEGEGSNRLLLLTEGGAVDQVLVEAREEVHWAYPRWSPDGRHIVAALRDQEEGGSAIVLLDPDGGAAGEAASEAGEAASAEALAAVWGEAAPTVGEASSPRVTFHLIHRGPGLHTTPTWDPSGRWVLWTGDRDDAQNLLARRVEGGEPVGLLRQGTGTATGVRHPQVDGAGEWVVLSRLGIAGWDLSRLPFEPEAWREVESDEPRPRAVAVGGGWSVGEGEGEGEGAGEGAGAAPSAAGDPGESTSRAAPMTGDRRWWGVSSARPRFWLPHVVAPEREAGVDVLPAAVGFRTQGQDVVGRHIWEVHAAVPWSDAGDRPEWAAVWSWGGLGQPRLVFSAQEHHESLGRLRVPEDRALGPDDVVYPTSRERRFGTDAVFVRARLRSSLSLSVGGREIRETLGLREADGSVSERLRLTRPERALGELRMAVAANTARSFPFSISPEAGGSVVVQGRERRHRALPDSLQRVPGMDGSYREIVGVAQGYGALELPRPFPSFARGVVALRVAAGAAQGPGAGPGHFGVGGGGGAADGLGGFSVWEPNPTFSVRGVPRNELRGDRAWAASAEVRVPVANLHRARGTVPMHLDRLAAGAFLDVAGAGRWTDGEADRRWERRSSVGVEATLRASFFHGPQQLVRAGIALPLGEGDGLRTYLQAGWSF